MMNYNEIVAYIEDIPKFTTKNAPGHTRALLDRMHLEVEKKKIIHVAGTNGKGSVCSFLDSCLRLGGYHVGLFTSPHLIRINERFMIDGSEVSDEDFTEAFYAVKTVVEAFMKEGYPHPTYFEMLFLMGMYLFDKADVTYIVLETGLGGRLDATNVIRHPLLSIITSISKDHMEYLGDTISLIAGEKAGIIKHGVPVIFDGHSAEASAVIENKAREMAAPYDCLTPDMYIPKKIDKDGITFDFCYTNEAPSELSISSVARYQMMNASLAYFAMKKLSGVHGITDAVLKEGIKRAVWGGRMETVLPGVILDGAHNEDGVAQFIETAVHFKKNHRITVLFGAVADKRYKAMIDEIAKGIQPSLVVACEISGSRVVKANELARLFKEAGCDRVITEPDIDKAFSSAYDLTFNRDTKDGLLFCVGSLYLVGELKAFLEKRSFKDGNSND